MAAAHPGDTVRIGAGSYRGGFTIDKNLTIVGAGAEATIIRGGNSVLTVGRYGATTEPTVSISDVEITGGLARTSPRQYP